MPHTGRTGTDMGPHTGKMQDPLFSNTREAIRESLPKSLPECVNASRIMVKFQQNMTLNWNE
jgi:hypothetical protein